jgi:microsomal dipeptidase-like Zn-dependent dipeptidase
MSHPTPPDWHKIHYQDSTIVDLHAHPSLKVSMFDRNLTTRLYPSSRAFDPFSVRTNYRKLKDGGVDALLSILYAPEREIIDECRYLKLLRYLKPRTWKKVFGQSYFDVTLQLLEEMEQAVAEVRDPLTGKPTAKFAHSVKELDQILNQGDEERPVALIHCVEGGHSLEGKLENLETLFYRGVAYLILVHFFENEIGFPCYPWPEKMQKFGCFQDERDISLGLKQFGEHVVENMVDLGMLIDVSHCTPPARARVYEIVGKRAPILATHVGAYEINPDPYNLQDWEIKKIAESGGVVGVIFMNYWLMPHETQRGINFITHTIKHFVNVGGIDHVGIGSDFDGFTDPPDDLKDASELPKLTQRMIAEGFDWESMVKIWGGNALRALRQGWGR